MVARAPPEDAAHVEDVEGVAGQDRARDPAAVALERLPLAEGADEDVAGLDRAEHAVGAFDLVVDLLRVERADGEAVALFSDDVGGDVEVVREAAGRRCWTRRVGRCGWSSEAGSGR